MSIVALELYHTPSGVTGGKFTLNFFMHKGRTIFFKYPREYIATYDGEYWTVPYEKETGISVCEKTWFEALSGLFSDWSFIYDTYGLEVDECLSKDAQELKRYVLSSII